MNYRLTKCRMKSMRRHVSQTQLDGTNDDVTLQTMTSRYRL